MPDVQNVFRRGGAYWWRRTLRWLDGNTQAVTLTFSLGTKDLGVARHRAAAMTAQSEVVRMGLYERIARDGLTADQRHAIFRTEMRAYRDSLDHLSAEWQFKPSWASVTHVDADLQVYEAIWGAFAETGVVDRASGQYADKHLHVLNLEQRDAARRLIGSLDLRHSLSRETAQRLEALGIEPNPTNMALATKIVLDARAQAARELRLGVDSVTDVASPPFAVERKPSATVVESSDSKIALTDARHIPERWRTLTPIEAAELLIASNPAMLEHRRDGKRAATQVGEQTLRQIRWAAVLLQKSMNPEGPSAGIRPFWTCTFNDIVTLDRWFDQLPVTCGKSPRDRKPDTSLQAICDRALDRIDAGELTTDAIGLDGVTTNKHLRKIKQIYDLARDEIDTLPEIRFAKFMVPDLKNERDARDAYTVEQAIEIFRCPPGPVPRTLMIVSHRAVRSFTTACTSCC